MMLPFNKTFFAEIPSQHLNIVLFVFVFGYKEMKDILIQLCIFEQTKQGHVKV